MAEVIAVGPGGIVDGKEIKMEVNEEKRQKFMENAGKRVNKVMHDIQILEPMARSNSYDFTKEEYKNYIGKWCRYTSCNLSNML